MSIYDFFNEISISSILIKNDIIIKYHITFKFQ